MRTEAMPVQCATLMHDGHDSPLFGCRIASVGVPSAEDGTLHTNSHEGCTELFTMADLRPLTLLADWTDAAGGMVISIPWAIGILVWTPITGFVEHTLGLNKIAGRVVMIAGIVGLTL